MFRIGKEAVGRCPAPPLPPLNLDMPYDVAARKVIAVLSECGVSHKQVPGVFKRAEYMIAEQKIQRMPSPPNKP